MEHFYLSIDGKNELKFFSNENKDKKSIEIYTSFAEIEDDNIGNGINKYFNNLIPDNGKDKIKISIKLIQKYKEMFNNILYYLDDSVNRILSFNSKNLFIFNEKNTSDLNNMLIYIFDLLKEKKISGIDNYEDLKSKIQDINNKNIDVVDSIFHNNKSFKSFALNNLSEKNKYVNSSIIDLSIFYETNLDSSKKNDNLILNKYSHKNIKQKYSLPIELIIILNKFNSINKLNFPIYNINEKKKIEILLILLNLEWIFPNVNEIIFNFNDYELEKRLNQINENQIKNLKKSNKIIFRTTNYDFKRNNKITWNAFNEISLFNNYDENLISRLSVPNFNNHSIELNNLNNDNSFLNDNLENFVNFDYIDVIKNKSQSINENDELYNDMNNAKNNTIIKKINNNYKKEEKFSQNKKDLMDENNKKIINIQSIIESNSNPFEIIIIYSYFVSLMKLSNLSLFFNDHYSNEIEIFLKNKINSIINFHFLLFVKKLNSLLELNLLFNSLDEKTFEKIIYIIFKNSKLEILRISFFASNSYYSPYSLIRLYKGLNYNLFHLINEQKKLISEKIDIDKEDIDLFIINTKLYESFKINISKLFFILDFKKKLKELVLLFDTPIIINNNDKYLNLIIKFIINILIMINSNKNKIEVLKIISPFLIFDNSIFPSLDDLLILADNRNNEHLKDFTFQFKIYQCVNLYYIIPYKLKILFLGDLDKISFDSFINYYKSNDFLNQSELISIKINLNLNIILLDNVIESCIDYLKYSPSNLKEKVLLSNMKTKNTSIMKSLLNVFFFSPINNIFMSFSRSTQTKFLNAKYEINNDNKFYINTIIKYIISKKKIKNKKYKTEVINRIKNYIQIPLKMNKKIFFGNKI